MTGSDVLAVMAFPWASRAYSKLGVRVHAKLCSVGWLARPMPNCWIIWAAKDAAAFRHATVAGWFRIRSLWLVPVYLFESGECPKELRVIV